MKMGKNFESVNADLTTGSNLRSEGVWNYANKHDSTCSPAAGDASNRDRNPGSRRNVALRSSGHWRTRLCESTPRVRRRLGDFHPRPRYDLALIAVVLLIPFSTAIGIGNISFTRANAEGIVTGAGELSAIDVDMPGQDLVLRISGTYSIEVEYVDRPVSLIAFSVEGDSGIEPPVKELGLGEMTMLGSGELFIDFDGAETSIQLGNPSFDQNPANRVWDRQYAGTQQIKEYATKDLLGLSSTQFTTIDAQGNFSFSLWDGALQINGEEYWAGERTDAYGDNELGVGSERAQILHVAVENGLLTGTLPSKNAHTYWNHVALQSPSTITIEDAIGFNAKNAMVLESWSMNLASGEVLLASEVRATSGTINGAMIQEPPTNWYWWLLAIPLVVVAAYFVRPPSAAIVRRMEKELKSNHYILVAAHNITRPLKSKHAGRASLYRATALLAIQQYTEAGLFLKSIEARARPDPATYHLLYANALAGIGSKDEATRELATCISLVPEYAQEASKIPLLAPLLGRAYALNPDYA